MAFLRTIRIPKSPGDVELSPSAAAGDEAASFRKEA
jgi:hypothetical protein